MKVYRSLYEMQLNAIFFLAATAFVPRYIDFKIRMIYLALMLCALFTHSRWIHKKSKKQLIAQCLINPFGFIELHVGSKKESKEEFLKLCAKSILKAQEMKMPILIDTWLREPKKMEEIFEDSIEIVKKVTLMQKIVNSWFKLCYNPKDLCKTKDYRYIINTTKLTDKQIKRLERIAK